jgi:hypothetical protein
VEHVPIDVQIPVGGNDVDAVRLDQQFFGDEFYRHPRKARQHFMQTRRHRRDVVHDHDRHAHVCRQMLQQAAVRVEATSGAADANHRKIVQRDILRSILYRARSRLPGLFACAPTRRNGWFKLLARMRQLFARDW